MDVNNEPGLILPTYRDAFFKHAIVGLTVLSACLLYIAFLRLPAPDYWFLSHTLFHDDSYYYFEIAKNWALTGRMTFSGYSETNGFHPAWAYVLGFLSRIHSESVVDIEPVVVQVALFVGLISSIVFILTCTYSLKRLEIPAHSFFAAFLYAVLWEYFFDGMESALVLTLLSVLLHTVVAGRHFLFILCSAALVWVRVDMLFFVPVLFCMGVVLGDRPRKTWLQHGGVLFACVIASLFSKHVVMSGHVSATVKLVWALHGLLHDIQTNHSVSQFLLVRMGYALSFFGTLLSTPMSAFTPVVLFNPTGHTRGVLVLAGAAVILLYVIASFGVFKAYGNAKRLTVSVIMVGGSCLYALLVSFLGWKPEWQWYLAGPSFVAWMGFLMLFSAANFSRVGIRLPQVGASIVIVFSMIGAVRFYQHIHLVQPREWRFVYQSMADVVDGLQLREGARVGTWAAGHVGFYSQTDIVNLEGLIEHPSVFDAFIQDDISPVIKTHKIEYILIKTSKESIEKSVKAAKGGKPQWSMSQRTRVFKDLQYSLVREFSLSGDRVAFSLYKIH
ncbi:Uncharacterised protein [BD1-7 clade bacterium]|uniref:Glycosyltransferase RgtA/B/C/D-like domain-containing protein n=1 Tax=BD1-7 clade bacterium TaxID=2029982 RepID=A0A5S9QI93_9GAMM|nr:Uncharacterised protein [BD1-7 clade bacterium]CAA0117234.1 Uncharacterised protein [BD1-7 clade bacterium]